MRPWMGDLLGLAIGFVIGGAALAKYLPQLEAWWLPPAPAQLAVAAAAPAPIRVPPPAPMPLVIAPVFHPPPRSASPAPEAPVLPNVVQPDEPKQSAGLAGTGFFIADDGTLLTAAHVVHDCRRIQVVSPFVPLTAARIVATDHKDDLALLQINGKHAPAVLPLGGPAARTGRMFILGYPATAGMRVPAQTWGALENAKLPPAAGKYADPGYLIWLEASAVTHGYSGGPILDPRNGDVVGLIRAIVHSASLRGIQGMPTTGVAIGPGFSRLIAFVQGQEPWLDVSEVSVQGDGTLDLARRATVHVFCWR